MSEEEIINILENYDNEDNLIKIHKAIQGILDLYQKEKEKNKELKRLIFKIRRLSTGVLSYDNVNEKKILGPKKNYSKQQLYKDFLEIKVLLKANYISLSNEDFIKELLEEE